MKLAVTSVLLATAGLAASQIHGHGHHHLHKQRKVDYVPGPVVFEYQLDGEQITPEQACQGIKDGKLRWADGVAPLGACETSSSVAPSSSTVAPAEFFAESSSSSTSSATPTSTSTPTPTSTSTTSVAPTSTSTSSVAPATTSVAPSTSSAKKPVPTGSQTPGGGVTIINNMGQDMYLWSVSNTPAQMMTLAPGQTYAETWRINPDGGGISIKVNSVPSLENVLQYEYTLSGDTIFWDVSLINMEVASLLTSLGFEVTSTGAECLSAICPPGDFECAAAYLFPTDDHATHGCPAQTEMTLRLGM